MKYMVSFFSFYKILSFLFLFENTLFPLSSLHKTYYYFCNSPALTKVSRKYFIRNSKQISVFLKCGLSFLYSYCFQKWWGLQLNSRCNYKAGNLPAHCLNLILRVLCSSFGKLIHFQISESLIIFFLYLCSFP
jgi:hypothetical protein